MINAFPIIGWLISFIVNVSLAIPFWLCWTYYEIGEEYFYFLPDVWRSIPFWNCVGLFMSVSIIKTVFVPKLVSIEQSNGSKKE